MKLGEVIPQYREYRKTLVEQTRALVKEREVAQKKFELTGDKQYADEAATLQLSVDASNELFEKNQEVLDRLTEQYCAAWNAEVAKQQSDPETGYGATMGKVMTTAMRMARGDNVPYTDEKKLQEVDEELYASAKQAQALMRQMKNHKAKDYDSLWDEEGGEYDPKGAAENAEATGELPDIPVSESSESESMIQMPDQNPASE